MSALEIHPHSRRGSRLAVALLVLFAAGAFVAGLNNQLIGARGLSPFPAASAAAGPRVADAIPEATPAPDMQLAEAAPPVVRHAAPPAPDPEDAAPAPPDDAPAATPPAVDAAATAPDAPPSAQPPPPATDSADPPT